MNIKTKLLSLDTEDGFGVTVYTVEAESLWKEFPNIFRLIDRDSPDLFIGYDPGSRHAGLSLISKHIGEDAYSIELKYPAGNSALERVKIIEEHFKEIFSTYFYRPSYRPSTMTAVIEGASHAEAYGQVELAEARIVVAKYLTEFDCKSNIQILAPSSIRKKALGNGKLKGKEMWKDILGLNAADSLVCALCAIKISKDTI